MNTPQTPTAEPLAPLTGSPHSVVINGVQYVPENSENVPDRANVWYMHDNHTFSRLGGGVEAILREARRLGKDSPYGMLCTVTLLRGEKEIRRLKKCVHARKELGDTSEWEAEVRGDADAVRLIEANAYSPDPRKLLRIIHSEINYSEDET